MEVYKTLVNGNQIELEDLSKENLLTIVKKQEEKILQYKNINETHRKNVESQKTQIHDLQKNKTNTDKVYKKLAKAEQTIQDKNEEIERIKLDDDNKSKKIKELVARNNELSLDIKKKDKKIETLETEISQLSYDCDNSEWLKQSNDICELMGKSTDGWSNVPGDTLHDVKNLLEENKELKAELDKLERIDILDKSDEEIKMIKKEILNRFIDNCMKWTRKKKPIYCRMDNRYYKNAQSTAEEIYKWFGQWAENQSGVIHKKGKDKNTPTRDEMQLWLEQWHKEKYNGQDDEWKMDPRGYPYSQNGTINNPRFNLLLIKNPSTGDEYNYN